MGYRPAKSHTFGFPASETVGPTFKRPFYRWDFRALLWGACFCRLSLSLPYFSRERERKDRPRADSGKWELWLQLWDFLRIVRSDFFLLPLGSQGLSTARPHSSAPPPALQDADFPPPRFISGGTGGLREDGRGTVEAGAADERSIPADERQIIGLRFILYGRTIFTSPDSRHPRPGAPGAGEAP